jgi:hypothetical protein
MADSQKEHDKFIKDVVRFKKVWGLKLDDNWAVSKSADFEDAEVLLFWSDKELAEACATDDWNDYKPESMETPEFLEEWLPGMCEEGIAVGANWNTDLEGIETHPISLALEIVNEIREQNIKYTPKGFESLSEFEAELMEMGEDL